LFNIENDEEEIIIANIPEINFNINELFISEFIPNPEGSDEYEWIELYNNSNEDINLLGWQIDDQEGGSNPYIFKEDTIIKTKDFLILNRSETKITLNNKNDFVRILNPLGDVWQETDYNNILEGESYSWDFNNNEWFINDTPTPGENNIFIPTEEIIWSIIDLEEAPENKDIIIKGIALHDVDKNALKIYLADFNNNIINYTNIIEIYFHKKDFPEIKKGDLLQLKGKLVKKDYLSRLKIKNKEDIILELENYTMDKPMPLYLDDIDDGLLGSFLNIKGIINKKSGKNIYLENEAKDTEIRVYTKFDTTNLSLKKDLEIVVSGILLSTSSGFKLLPFNVKNILVPQIVKAAGIKEEGITETSSSTVNIISKKPKKYTFILFIVIWLFILILSFIIKKKD